MKQIRFLLLLLCSVLLGTCSEEEDRLVFIGDSITHRWDVERMFANYVCVNLGKDGSRVEDWNKHANDYPDATVVVWLGTNNLSAKPECVGNIEAQYELLLQSVVAKRIVVIAIAPRGEGHFVDIVPKVNAKLLALCEKRGIAFVDVYPVLQRDGVLDVEYSSDMVHLNEYGLWRVAACVKKLL